MKRIRILLFASLVSIVVACGSDKGEGVGPNGSVIVITPSALNFEYPGTTMATFAGPTFVTVTLLNAFGSPIRGATVNVFNAGDNTILASDKLGTFGASQLEPFVGTTDDFGNVYVYIFVPLSFAVGESSYDFEAFSGGAFTNMTITTTCDDVNTATATVCD